MPQLTLNATEDKVNKIVTALKAQQPQAEDNIEAPLPLADGERIKRFIRRCLREEVYRYDCDEIGKTVVVDDNIVTW